MNDSDRCIVTIKNALNHSTAELDESIARRLTNARRHAITHIPRTEHESARNGSQLLLLSAFASPHAYRYWLSLALLILLLFGGNLYWQRHNESDQSEIDIAILTDELPIHVYVD